MCPKVGVLLKVHAVVHLRQLPPFSATVRCVGRVKLKEKKIVSANVSKRLVLWLRLAHERVEVGDRLERTQEIG